MKRRDVLYASALFATGSATGLATGPACAQTAVDHIMPKTPGEKGAVGPLHTITIVTPDLQALKKMYCDGMGMELTGPLTLAVAERATLGAAWQIPKPITWNMYLLRRPTVPMAGQIRLIVTDTPTPAIRKSWNRQELGPYGMGFPTTDVPAWDKTLSGMGYQRSTPEIERFALKRTDGTPYDVLEATFDGPEFLRNIAISRRDGMAQVGDLDVKTGRGGPAYATQVVDDIDGTVKFFTDVLDFEVRVDRIWRMYEVPFRFVTVYAKGAANGHVALVKYDAKDVVAGTGAAPTMPHRGMAMWSFQTSDLGSVRARATSKGSAIVAAYADITAADLGKRKALLLRLPSGFLIEVFERLT